MSGQGPVVPIRVSIFLALACLVWATVLHFTDWNPQKETDRLKRQIDADLPAGCSKDEVKRWLAGRRLSASDTAGRDGRSSQLTALMHRDYFFAANADIQIVFHFDEGDRQLEHQVSWSARLDAAPPTTRK